MTNKPAWMLSHFASDLVRLNAELVEEGKRYAIVRITDTNQKSGYSKVGFILVLKSGRYGVTPHDSLFEGMPNVSDFFAMKGKLEKKDSE